MLNRIKRLIDNPWGIGAFAVLFIGSAVSYVLLGRFDRPESTGLLLGMSGFLFIFTFVYIRFMEDVTPDKWIGFSMVIWFLGWLVENVSQRSGLLGGYYHYDYAKLHALSLGSVPLLVPTIWLLFSLLVGSISHYLNDRPEFMNKERQVRFLSWKYFERSLISGGLMLSIDFAIEWHFSSVAGFWKWRIETGPSLDGIPIGNFILWFGVGFLIPTLEKGTGVPARNFLREDRFLRALPALGLCVLLGAGGIMNLFYGFLIGAGLCVFSLSMILGFVLKVGLTDMKDSSIMPAKKCSET